MKTRTLTGAVILLVTALFVFLKQFSSLFFDAFALTVMYFSLYEVAKAYKLSGKDSHTPVLYSVPITIWLGYNLSKKLFGGFPEKIMLGGIFVIAFVAVMVLLVSLTLDILIAKQNRKPDAVFEENQKLTSENFAFETTKTTMQIFAYPILPLAFFFALNTLPYQVSYIGLILTFVVAMMTDTFAYLFGKFFGKTKFIPEISPKKTVAGVVGGFVGALVGTAVCFVIFYFTPYFSVLNETSLTNAIVSFVVIALVGSYITQLGDLIASALKRKVGIKDYGNIFPGHGGFMDRVDGQMFVAVWVYLVLALFFV